MAGTAPASSPCGTAEGSLDVQYMQGVCPGVSQHVWATAGQRFDPDDGQFDNEPFLKWVRVCLYACSKCMICMSMLCPRCSTRSQPKAAVAHARPPTCMICMSGGQCLLNEGPDT